MNIEQILMEFHFLRPWWLLAIVPLLLLVFTLRRQSLAQSGWKGVLATHLYQHLVTEKGAKKASPPWALLTIVWTLVCLALAGPSWERLPQPVYQLNQGKVILIDMSMSMRATDIVPNRLTRAKFKAIDLANSLQDGELGLVAYAGDAFTISPLTSDVQNITSLIPSLSPEIMPVPGSEPQYGLENTIELLKSAGYQTGEIYWITDGVELAQIAPIKSLVNEHGYSINILGVGTEDGAPIKLQDGEFMKDIRGAVVVPQLQTSSLKAIAKSTGGKYVDMQPDDADIEYLSNVNVLGEEIVDSNDEQNQFGDQWKEFGPYLVLLILPFAAYGFRKGVLSIVFVMLLPLTPQKAHADWWADLWQTKDQQGMKSFNSEEFQVAADTFTDPMWKGSAQYKNGEFEAAADSFSKLDTVDSNYNLGNALAKSQLLQEAIDAYTRVLELDPNHEDAAFNKKLLEDLLQQQEQQQQNQQDQQDNENQNDSQQEDSEQQDSENDSQQEDSSEQNQQQQSQEQQSQEQQSESEQQEQNESQSQQEQQNPEDMEQQEQDAQQEGENEENQQEELQQAGEQRELTEEEMEQLQKMQKLLRKIPDDPAFLLQRKMQLEQQRRKRQRLPNQSKRDW